MLLLSPSSHPSTSPSRLCRRRIFRLFSKLSHLAITPSAAGKRSRKGYKILHQEEESDEFESNFSVPKVLVFDRCLLPPLISTTKKTIFLDLDQTLVHSSTDPPPKTYDFIVKPSMDDQIMNFYVLKRPGVDFFLEEISKEYASQVLDKLDPEGRFISHRLYRYSCKEVNGKFVKDLSEMGRNLGRLVIVDDNPNAYSLQPENAVPIRPFVDDSEDRELEKLLQFFEWSKRFEDMRVAVMQYYNGGGTVSGGDADDCEFVQKELIPGKIRFADLCDVCRVRPESVQPYMMDQASNAAKLLAHVMTDSTTLRSWVNFPWEKRIAEVDLQAGDDGYTYSCSKGIRKRQLQLPITTGIICLCPLCILILYNQGQCRSLNAQIQLNMNHMYLDDLPSSIPSFFSMLHPRRPDRHCFCSETVGPT
ncbi:putative Aquaporin NIP1.1 [Hibiscus syriacus]|uniref:Aquaporin NIP1.1 n=1 Tax=Hibiscus syriacus TaxID=106335 RepID=A0A6A2YA18_HIBSY|nr:putative Aquaporin NIP1.1 [Hibiscus syriacus]